MHGDQGQRPLRQPQRKKKGASSPDRMTKASQDAVGQRRGGPGGHPAGPRSRAGAGAGKNPHGDGPATARCAVLHSVTLMMSTAGGVVNGSDQPGVRLRAGEGGGRGATTAASFPVMNPMFCTPPGG